jgi:predicted N-formylglutamate amidohydrolase
MTQTNETERRSATTSQAGMRPRATETLLDAAEPPAFEIVNAAGSGTAVLFCDHASNRIPRRLGSLGLDPAALQTHIAWDPGAAELARQLSARLDAPLVLSGYSRLVIDCNRPPDSPESIPPHSAGVAIPGNLVCDDQQRALRLHGLFQPYHGAIEQLLDQRAHRPSLLLSLHSFTPVLAGQHRPWSIGISHRRDRGLGALMLAALARDPLMQASQTCIGDNQPYPIEDQFDYTLPVHGEGRGLANIMIELRQDGLRTSAETGAWAERLAVAFRSIEAEALAVGPGATA